MYLEYPQASSVRVRPHQQLQANGSVRAEYRVAPKHRQQSKCFLFCAFNFSHKLLSRDVMILLSTQFVIVLPSRLDTRVFGGIVLIGSAVFLDESVCSVSRTGAHPDPEWKFVNVQRYLA